MKSGSALVDRITVEDRYRRDLGDIRPLAESIKALGLLHPIVVTSDTRLIAGQRRLEAVRSLGWRDVDVRIADDMDSAVALLAAERDENTCRKDMTASELFALGQALEELERPAASARQGTRTDLGSELSGSATGKLETREVVGEALGVSGATYQRLKHIGQRASGGDIAAVEIMDTLDRGEQTINGAYKRLRRVDILNAPDVEPTAKGTTGRVGDPRTITRRKPSARLLQSLVEQVQALSFGVSSIDVDELSTEEAGVYGAGLTEGLSALITLRTQLRKAAQ